VQGSLVFDIFDLKSVEKVKKTFLSNGGITRRLNKATKSAIDEIRVRSEKRMHEIMAGHPTRNGTLAGSNLASTITSRSVKDGFVIEVNGEYALYVEFGTGIVGEENPHPNALQEGWEYDMNDHGENGWFYIGADGIRHWTKGMPARPYIYQTSLYVRRITTRTVNKHIKKVLK